MRESAGKAATQRQPDARPPSPSALNLRASLPLFPLEMFLASHVNVNKDAGNARSTLWTGRPLRSVLTYFHGNLCCFVAGQSRQYDLTSLVPSLYHCERRRAKRFSLCKADVLEGGAMDSAYQPWIGQPVILQVALGDIKVPLRGKLLKDGGETVRMRIGDGWDVDIYKVMILAVEQDAMALLPA